MRPAVSFGSAATPARRTALGIVLAILLGLGWAVLYINALFAPRALAGPVSLSIPTAASSREVAGLLYRRGLIASPWVFDVYVRVRRVDESIKPGFYRFGTGLSLPRLTDTLVAGPPSILVTIPGGLTVDQIASYLAARGLVDKAHFLRDAADERFNYGFLKGVPAGPGRLEGFLYPDSYLVADGPNQSDTIINMMLRRFEQEEVKLDYAPKAKAEGLTVRQAVTVASIVEREAQKNDQRAEVAGVIMNRLKLNMPIQSDATVRYALGTHAADLPPGAFKVASPYNTYLHAGLPPGPIASAGEASLLASVQPARTSDLYFLAKPDGTLVFSSTLAGQNANSNRYLK
ncbi:MAG: endolytic transglycosylase MltG [Peptococcaceae bacterium]|nr:endolytic transglycosylase MltG [Peptococcaceae bacterium]